MDKHNGVRKWLISKSSRLAMNASGVVRTRYHLIDIFSILQRVPSASEYTRQRNSNYVVGGSTRACVVQDPLVWLEAAPCVCWQ